MIVKLHLLKLLYVQITLFKETRKTDLWQIYSIYVFYSQKIRLESKNKTAQKMMISNNTAVPAALKA